MQSNGRKLNRPRGSVLLAFVISFAAACAPQSATPEKPEATAGHDAEVAAVRVLVGKYVQSVDDADTTLAGEIWLRSPHVSFIHPRGHEVGWETIPQSRKLRDDCSTLFPPANRSRPFV